MKPTPVPALMENLRDIVERRGRKALEKAEKEILSKYPGDDVVSEALRYFVQTAFHGALPVFPALISISCEAVGRETEKTTSIGSAIMLMAGAADVHDDVIDRSLRKGSKLTVLGKFGKEIAILVGDALLLQGAMLLHKECESLPQKQRTTILNLVAQSFLEISCAEALETRLKGKLDLSPEACHEIIRMKATVPELSMKIGAVLGNAGAALVESLGNFGRTYGIISAIIEDFMDLLEYSELRNRLKTECPPLPLLYALQNSRTRTKILALIEGRKLTKKSAKKIASLALKSKEAQKLKEQSFVVSQNGFEQLDCVRNAKAKRRLASILLALTERLRII